MTQPGVNVTCQDLSTKISELLAAAPAGQPLKSSFLKSFWKELEADYGLMVIALVSMCEKHIRDIGIVARVDGRVKSFQSVEKTLDRREKHRISTQQGPYRNLGEMFLDMHDLAGIRIVVDYPSQLEAANLFIANTFQAAKKPNVFTRDRPVGKEWNAWFGAYQSYNHHVTLKAETKGVSETYRNVIFEIQLTSLPESLYNKLAHPLLYKEASQTINRQDEMVIDLSHGLSLCYSICLLYMQDKLGDHDTSSGHDNLRAAMRSAVADTEASSEASNDGTPKDEIGSLLKLIPDSIRHNSHLALSNRALVPNNETVPAKLLTSILSTLPDECDSPEKLWTSFVSKLPMWDEKLEAVGTAVKKQTRVLQQHHQNKDDRKCFNNLKVINPSNHKKTIQNTKGGLLKEAYQWVLEHEHYTSFQDHTQNRLLWVKGDPGKGKTMLLCGIIDQLEARGSHAISYFFCEATQDYALRCAPAVLRSLIWLLCSHHPSLISHVRSRYDQEGRSVFEDGNAFQALGGILADILRDNRCPNTIFLVDALDECSADTRSDLIRLIIQLSKTHIKAKWIVSSRNWPMIEEQFRVAGNIKISLELNQKSVSKAVDLFINHKVAELAKIKNYDTPTKAVVLDTLRHRANDTFLWVALVYLELSRPEVRSRNTIERLASIPEGLEKLYERMLDDVIASEDSALFKKVLATASIAARPISFLELQSFIQDLENFNAQQMMEMIEECGSFLFARDYVIYFVHQSAQDFLISRTGKSQIFEPTIEGHHLKMLRSALVAMRTLRRNMFNLELPGIMIDDIATPEVDPLRRVRYHCQYWVDHLGHAAGERQRRDDDLVLEFLNSKLLYWIEALSLQRHVPEAVTAAQKLKTIMIENQSRQLQNLTADLYMFIVTFRHALELAPLQIYTSALLFAPTSSLVKSLYVTEAPHWVVLKPGPPTDWDAHSITLEGHSKAVTSVCLSDDGKYLISLSSDNNLRSWDTTTASCKQSIRDLPDCSCIALSPNGSQIAVCLSSATIHMLDSNLAISNIEIKLNHPPLLSISFSPDGKYLAGVVAGIVTIWDSATGNCERSLSEAATSLGFIDILDETYYVSFSRNGKQVVTATLGGEVKIWDVPTGSCRVAFTCAQAVTFLSQSTIMAAEECYLIVWDIQQKSRALSWLAHNDPIQSIVSLNCQGLSSASCGTDLSIKIWDQAGNLIQQLEGHGRQVNSLDFSPRNGLLASASNDHTIKLWDLTRFSSSRLNKLRGGQSASVDRRKLHVNVEQGLIADGVGQHFKRHIRWGESLKPFRETFFQSASPSVLSKLRRQIICSMAGSLANEKSFDTLRYEEHPSRILAVALSPNHHWLASVAEDASVNIWDISKSICVFTRSLGISLDLLLPSLVFSSNGNQLVLTTANIRYCFPIARFGTTTWKSVHEFWYRGFRGGKFDRSHISHLGNDGSDSKDLDIDKTFPIGAVDCGAESLSADHKLIARATGRSTVVRSITTGELIRAIPRGAAAMTFSPDGDILVLASEDCLCAYEVGTGQQLWETSTDDNPLRGRPEAVAISHGAKVLAVSWFWGDCYAWKPNIHKFPRPFLTHRNLDDKNLNSKMEVTVNEKWLVLCSRPKTYVYDLENSVLRQIIDNALYINRLILDPADNDLVHTNVGTWILRKENGIALKGNGLSFDGAWVMRDSERLLWLPSQYRSSFPSVVGSFVALGNAQGSFALLQFSP